MKGESRSRDPPNGARALHASMMFDPFVTSCHTL